MPDAAAISQSEISTVTGVPRPQWAAAASPPSEASAVADMLGELRALVKAAAPAAALSAELTMTQASARRRGIAAIVSTAAAVTYALIDAVVPRLVEAKTPPDMDQRVEALERKVDGIAEDVAAIADAVADD